LGKNREWILKKGQSFQFKSVEFKKNVTSQSFYFFWYKFRFQKCLYLSSNMKIIFIWILFFALSTNAFAQSERIIYENFRPKGKEVSFDLPGEIEVKFWGREKIRILTVINCENCDSVALNSFVDSGRYELKQSVTDGISLFNMPKQFLLPANIADKAIKESFKFVVHLPEGLIYRQNPE
jgi:hypothetical protein